MIRLLDNRWGRLYAVAQIVSIIISILLCAKFLREDREIEKGEINGVDFAIRMAAKPGDVLPSPEQQAPFLNEILRIQDSHRNSRIMRFACYLFGNFAVPAFWIVALFVADGLRKRAQPTSGSN